MSKAEVISKARRKYFDTELDKLSLRDRILMGLFGAHRNPEDPTPITGTAPVVGAAGAAGGAAKIASTLKKGKLAALMGKAGARALSVMKSPGIKWGAGGAAVMGGYKALDYYTGAKPTMESQERMQTRALEEQTRQGETQVEATRMELAHEERRSREMMAMLMAMGEKRESQAAQDRMLSLIINAQNQQQAGVANVIQAMGNMAEASQPVIPPSPTSIIGLMRR